MMMEKSSSKRTTPAFTILVWFKSGCNDRPFIKHMTTNTHYEPHCKCVGVKEIMQEACPDLRPNNIGGVWNNWVRFLR